MAAGLYVVLLVAAIVLYGATAPAPTSGGAATLEYIAQHRALYIVEQQLWLVPGVPAMVTYLALYLALKHVNKSYAALGALVGGAAWALTLAIPTTSTGAPALVYLSDQYAAATDIAQRASFVAAAESLIALNNTPTVVGVLTTVGMLTISVVMLRGVFHKATAYLGIATGTLGIASEALRYAVPDLYGLYGILLLIWMGAVGWKLLRLSPSPAAAGEGTEGVRDSLNHHPS
ncbi:MAG: DUF4386 family protein [Anaerolineae bacterium]